MSGTPGVGGEARATLHLIKLCVGTDSVEELREWQASRAAGRVASGEDPRPRHITRMWPRRTEDLLGGGSLFWVIRGVISVRQRLEEFVPLTGEDGIRRCAIVLDPELVRVAPRRRSAFQGWRYLAAADAPADLPRERADEPALPPGLQEAMAHFGVGCG